MLLILSAAFSSAFSQNVDYVYNEKEHLLKIDSGVAVFVDESKQLKIEDVVKQEFILNSAKVPNFGISVDRIWMRFQVHNQTDERDLFLLVAQSSLDRISLYTKDQHGKWGEFTLGSYKKYSNRFVDIPDYAFPVSIPFNSSKEFYISIQSKDQIQVPIYLGTERAMSRFALNNSIVFGIYLGIIVIMALYHFFIYFSVEKVSYLFYILFILTVGLVQMDFQGYAFKFLWPNSPWMASNSSFLVPMLSGLFTALFVKRFLYTKFFTPKLNVGINIYMLLCVSAASIGLLGYHFVGVQLLQAIALIGAIYAMIIAFIIMKKDYRPAKFFLIAFAIFFVSIIVFVLRNFNVVPYTLFTSYILEIGSTIQIVLLSFALADEINSYRRAKEQSQAHAFEVLKENDRIIKEQNLTLEKEVKIRTSALSESNENLQKLLIDLKQAQTQLVEAEKLASLGMLTAGIAHEINNPINFVTSNISPLRRDINQIFQALKEMEQIGLSTIPVDEKKEQIKELKSKLEIDYLKQEVKFLLEGIEDGAKRTTGIVKSLRTFSRVDEYDLKLADINLGMQSTLVILNSHFDDNIEMQINYEDLPLIDCYPEKLNQVFLNLLTNAAYALKKKFGAKAGGVLKITTRFDGDFVYIHVEDNGPGINDEVKSKIFDPFYTTKDVGEGTGIGLSIAYQTVLKHRGEIIINSTPDHGAEFIVKLPITHDDNAENMESTNSINPHENES
jgi:signal transduction histidine kinase